MNVQNFQYMKFYGMFKKTSLIEQLLKNSFYMLNKPREIFDNFASSLRKLCFRGKKKFRDISVRVLRIV